MFQIDVASEARERIRALRRVDAAAVLDAIETHLRFEPDRPSRSRIKRLRGAQDATFRLRVGDYRVFYDVAEGVVTVITVLHKRETPAFYRKDEP